MPPKQVYSDVPVETIGGLWTGHLKDKKLLKRIHSWWEKMEDNSYDWLIHNTCAIQEKGFDIYFVTPCDKLKLFNLTHPLFLLVESTKNK